MSNTPNQTNNWSPRIETGLTGNRYPEEDLHPHTPDGRPMKEPGVYVLKCSKPPDWETVQELWNDYYEIEVQPWVRSAFEAEGILYVGGSKSVLDRLHEHLQHPNRSASILQVYPIHSVWDVEWHSDVEEAFTRESALALELQADLPGYYVHQH